MTVMDVPTINKVTYSMAVMEGYGNQMVPRPQRLPKTIVTTVKDQMISIYSPFLSLLWHYLTYYLDFANPINYHTNNGEDYNIQECQ